MSKIDTENERLETSRKHLDRRDFLKLGLTTGAAGAAVLAARQASQAGVPAAGAATVSEPEKWVKTTCALCPSGCGLEVRVVNGKAVKVEGNALHPVNQGVCCLKGQTSLEILYSPERLKAPRRQKGPRGGGDWEEISWDEALSIVAERLSDLRQQGLAHTVAVMHGDTRGQLRHLLQRFTQAYGTPNLIGRDSLGEGAARQALFLTQGINGLPVYDFNNASYVMTFGGNLLESNRNVISALGALAFMRRGRPQRGKLVVAHPRLSLTGIKGDEWVPIRPGTYAALALGMASVIITSELYDAAFVKDFTFGFEDFEDESGQTHMGFKRFVLEQYPLERAASITGVPSETIARLAGEFATNRPAVAVLPTEAGELSAGNALYTAMAIHALNALVGSIDTQGGVLVQRFPNLTAWPEWTPDSAAEAGLAQPRVDGAGSAALPLAISAAQNVADSILAERPYPVNALFLVNANPAYELVDGGKFQEALLKVPFVVSFSQVLDESAAHADLILPATTFLEEWGDDYVEGTGFAGISLRQPVVAPDLKVRSPGDVLLDLAARLGGKVAEALPWKDYWELVQYRLKALELNWETFEANGNWSEMVYFNAAPGSKAWSQVVGRDRLNAPQDGRFDFYSRELFALLSNSAADKDDLDAACLPHFEIPTGLAENRPEAVEYPLLLVTQPLITQSQNWQGIVPTLQEAYGLQETVKWQSWVEINPRVAESLHIRDNDLVWVESPSGRIQATARLYEGLWPNAVFVPGGLGHHSRVRWGRNSPANAQVGANVNLLTAPATEPVSGLAILGPTRVRIYKA